MPVKSRDSFRAAAKDAPAEIKADDSVRDLIEDAEVKVDQVEERRLQFTISSESVDRMGDTIKLDGWKLDNYRKNPQVFFNHDPNYNIGVADKIWIEDKKLKAIADFQPAETSRLAESIFRQLTHPKRFLRATSVGFRPLKYAFSDDPQRRYGIDFLEQELLEFSIVTVPANPDAMIDAKSAGIDIEPMIDYHVESLIRAGAGDRAEDTLAKLVAKFGKSIVTRDRVEALERAATAKRIDEARQRRNRTLELMRLKGSTAAV